MPSVHAWQSCIDVRSVPVTERETVVNTLNWLEENSPVFSDMIYDIRQKQKAEKREKIKAHPISESEAIMDWLANSFNTPPEKK